MSSARAKFLAAIAAAPERRFTCVMSKAEIIVRAPSWAEREAATEHVQEAWKGRFGPGFVMHQGQYQEAIAREVLAMVARFAEESEPVGRELVEQLNEEASEQWMDQLDQIDRQVNPDITEQEFDKLMGELLGVPPQPAQQSEKKRTDIAQTLNTYAPSKLRALLLTMVSRPSEWTTPD